MEKHKLGERYFFNEIKWIWIINRANLIWNIVIIVIQNIKEKVDSAPAFVVNGIREERKNQRKQERILKKNQNRSH